jgi:nucleoside-diphosphate-sugar epimerase
VTGATGFIGRHLVEHLERQRVPVRRVLREPDAAQLRSGDVVIGDLGAAANWHAALEGVDTVVHLAALAHRSVPSTPEAFRELHQVNVASAGELASAAGDVGVRRIVFVSSIGVNGESTAARPFTEHDPPHPHDPYSASKLEAERLLADLSRQNGIELVVVRPPLVYGRGAPGNFARLVRLVQAGWPLPLGAIDNRRSLVSVANLCDALGRLATHDQKLQDLFLVSDGDDISTPDLVRSLAAHLGVKPRLVAVPPALLRAAASLTGRTRDYERLCGSLVVDSAKIRCILGWRPPQTLDEGLRAAVGPDR